MNALTTAAVNLNNTVARPVVVAASQPSRPQRRERDFGVGYGNSSGYAAPRRYVADSSPRPFRLH